MKQDFQKLPTNVSKKVSLGVVAIVLLVVGIYASSSAFEDCDRSEIYVNQFPLTGEFAVWTDGGVHGQWWGTIHEYHKTTQVEFTGVEKNNEGYIASGSNPGAAVTFNDRGRGYIIGSLRVVLPTDEKHMTRIQTDFGSEESLIATLIKPTLYKVVTSCGPLMSSLESVSETRTDLIQYITDQLNNGVYKTKSTKTEITNELTGEPEVITKAEIIFDAKAPGGYKRQELSPFSQYGITCNLVSITDIKYDKATQDQIDAQKQANLAVVTAKTKSLEAIQKTVLITEQGKAEAEKAKWEQEKIKAVEVTKAQQEFEVAKLAAETAQQEALRIKAEGEAEAAAAAAKVRAGLTPERAAEIKKETLIGIAHEFANANVDLVPKIMVGNGGNGGSDPMQTVGLNMLMQVLDRMNKMDWSKK
jgi:hypothetical protein